MILALLAALGVGWWMWKKGELRRFDTNDLAIAGFAIVGLILTMKGNEISGPTMLIIAAIWFARTYAPGGSKRSHPMGRSEALRILELGPDPDAAAIRDAHRRLVSRVHPDRGGSAELAAQVNRARDVLLSRAN
ncbi:molecular chaperone DnaJ [Sphingomonas montanisoli]|uniref:Molecular chaperone DnaJ n=1 Tax=Sphingomonas montanisoli TaxID=2606412 RepID=A0A5D9C5X8_9SPHN|nr:molecular chaperone DnaJ [Sphingomonas montanisoli]TZG26450.1 molecular chaperone DnaJ [Sphingomonas montanisoli]